MIRANRTMPKAEILKNQHRWFFESLGFFPELGRRYPNPLDQHHSKRNCTFARTSEGVLLFKDHRLKKTWNAWELVCEAGKRFECTQEAPKLIETKSRKLTCRYRANPDEDYYKFFAAGGIDIRIEGSVHQVSRIFFGEEGYRPNDLTISYVFPSKREKVYRPFNKSKKWMCTTSDKDIWNFRPDQEQYYLTSSMKDALTLKHNLGVNAIAAQSETSVPNDLLDHLRDKDVYVVFDSDEVGLKEMRQLNQNFGFKTIVLSEKDPYELVVRKGSQQLKKEVYDQIEAQKRIEDHSTEPEVCPF